MFLSVPVLMKHNLQFVCIYLKKQLIHPDFVKFIQLFNKKKRERTRFYHFGEHFITSH